MKERPVAALAEAPEDELDADAALAGFADEAPAAVAGDRPVAALDVSIDPTRRSVTLKITSVVSGVATAGPGLALGVAPPTATVATIAR